MKIMHFACAKLIERENSWNSSFLSMFRFVNPIGFAFVFARNDVVPANNSDTRANASEMPHRKLLGSALRVTRDRRRFKGARDE